MHRKPYLTIGSLVYSAAYLIYGIYAAQAKHDLVLLCACTFFGAVGLVRIKNVWRDELGSYGGGSYRARGPLLSIYMSGVLFHVECCIR